MNYLLKIYTRKVAYLEKMCDFCKAERVDLLGLPIKNNPNQLIE